MRVDGDQDTFVKRVPETLGSTESSPKLSNLFVVLVFRKPLLEKR